MVVSSPYPLSMEKITSSPHLTAAPLYIRQLHHVRNMNFFTAVVSKQIYTNNIIKPVFLGFCECEFDPGR